MKYIIGIFAFFIVSLTSAQEFSSKKQTITIPLAGKVNLKNQEKKEEWNARVINLEMPAPGGEEYRSFLREQKEIQRKEYPVKTERKNSKSGERGSVEPPSTGNMFEGNAYNFSVPADNSMAISNDGVLISAINSTIWMFDVTSNELLYSGSLGQFVNNTLSGLQSKFDPKVSYDPVSDRFMVVFLYASSPTLSKIIIAFSQTNDPTGEWNIYNLSGNPFGNNRWTDYPAISQNSEDFFITGNLIIPGEPWQTGFDGSLIWQINKDSGYNGAEELTLNLWSDITYGGGLIRNLNPVDGLRCLSEDNLFFLSNRNFDLANDTIFLLEVTNTLSSGEAELNISAIEANDSYFLAPEARQTEEHTFDTNDSRVLGAVLFENSIQFVQNCLDTLNGITGVYHGTISNLNNTTPQINGNIVSFPAEDIDVGYPNISHIGNETDENTLISFVHSGPTHFAGTSCVLYDEFINDYSSRVVLKEGMDYVDVLNGVYERWGDYSGSQTMYSFPGTAWISGSYGTDQKRNGTWIAELSTTGEFFVDVQELDTSDMNIMAFPNPANEFVSVRLNIPQTSMATISLFNISGKLISNLYEDRIKSGENLLTFDIAHLLPGSYVLRVLNAEGVMITEKMIKK